MLRRCLICLLRHWKRKYCCELQLHCPRPGSDEESAAGPAATVIVFDIDKLEEVATFAATRDQLQDPWLTLRANLRQEFPKYRCWGLQQEREGIQIRFDATLQRYCFSVPRVGNAYYNLFPFPVIFDRQKASEASYHPGVQF